MSIWGTILGGAAGFALGGPIGALVGAAAGHAVGRIAARRQPPPAHEAAESSERNAAKRIAFTIAVIALGAKMAKADGVVSRSEVAAFKEVFRVYGEELADVGRVFDRARKDAAGFEPYARQVAGMFHRRSKVLEELLDGLFHIAKADGEVTPAELAYLRRVAEVFGFLGADFERIRAANLGPDEADPYRVLGVERGVSDSAVKTAYRKLIRETHPDRLMAKGMPEEFVRLANGKTAAINAAYDRIAKERGMR